MKVLVTAPINPDALALVEKHLPVTKAILISTEDLKKIIGDYEILLMRTDQTIDRDMLEHAKKLKIVAVASIGLDHVDLDAAKEKGVLVFNSPGGNSQSVAELAIGLMMNLARKIIVADRDVRQGIWERSKYGGVELEGKTLGLIAIGNIGTRVAKMAQAIGMSVIAVDPYVPADRAAQANIELTTLDEVISRSDVISIHSPLTKETHHLINTDRLAKMKKTAMLINTARGPIIDEKALYNALKNSTIGGAAVDVFEEEPCHSSPLFELDNCIVLPHLGGVTGEALKKMGFIATQRLIEEAKKLGAQIKE